MLIFTIGIDISWTQTSLCSPTGHDWFYTHRNVDKEWCKKKVKAES